ncbi:hypothetical protein [Sulfuricurvum sp.]|uniref:hypothetical protein n=1 Tax=Sulfuricurvum sp. TaxID=2025608 RepID=UPI00263066A5|nr:hypothetical protein [Sulfuricurvum sp.]MDD3596193.1 hypothetical protein [Sulfuricurvum sp.]
MAKLLWLSIACATVLSANESELELLKQQMSALHEQMMQMQQKIAVLENTAKMQATNTSQDETLTSMVQNDQKTAQTTMLPDIAVILNGGYTSRSVSKDAYAAATIPGFVNDMEVPFNAKNGFNFNYAEVAMSSTVDPFLDASAIFHIDGSGGIEVEEAYFTTRALDYGFKAKAGKFKSAFGRVNEKHHHAWNFEDQELINYVLFGPEGLGGEGGQIQWVAPTPFYLMAGFELFDGNPEQGFSAKESATTGVGYLKMSQTLGKATVLAGLSYAQGKSEVQNLDLSGEPIANSYTDYGQTRIYGADLTVEYPLGAFSSLIWQNEWMQRDQDAESQTQKQAGFYSELLYRMDGNWASGIRYDDLYRNVAGAPDDLNRFSAKLEYKPFEFSRFRLQYNHDRSKAFDDERKTVHEVLLNYTLELGAHGAHAF